MVPVWRATAPPRQTTSRPVAGRGAGRRPAAWCQPIAGRSPSPAASGAPTTGHPSTSNRRRDRNSSRLEGSPRAYAWYARSGAPPRPTVTPGWPGHRTPLPPLFGIASPTARAAWAPAPRRRVGAVRRGGTPPIRSGTGGRRPSERRRLDVVALQGSTVSEQLPGPAGERQAPGGRGGREDRPSAARGCSRALPDGPDAPCSSVTGSGSIFPVRLQTTPVVTIGPRTLGAAPPPRATCAPCERRGTRAASVAARHSGARNSFRASPAAAPAPAPPAASARDRSSAGRGRPQPSSEVEVAFQALPA